MDMPSWLTASATVALALFACVQICRELCAGKRRRRGAESQVNLTAFLLSLQLKSWDLDQQDEADQRLAETRIEELARLAPEVRGHISKRIETAFVAFEGMTRNLKEFDAYSNPQDAFSRSQLKIDAKKSLAECLDALEDGPISRDRLDAYGHLQERREKTSLSNQIEEQPAEEVTGKLTNEGGVVGSQLSEGSE